jgi:hypothetical protein
MSAASRENPGQYIASGLGGTAPVDPNRTVIDSSGIVWMVPGGTPANPPAPPAAPADAAQPANQQGGPQNQGAGSVVSDPRQVAVEILHEVPLPVLQVRMSPQLGLVALPAWFWLEGADGRAVESSRTVDVPPAIGADVPAAAVPADDPRRRGTSFRVDVRVWPVRYLWSFGDGVTHSSQSFGRKYPEQSDVQHVYGNSSLGSAAGYAVRVDVEYAAEFRVNGGPPQALPSITRTFESSYRVQEIQSVLTRR